MSESCLFIPEYENPCLRKIKYGNYCYKHRHNYLIIDGYISHDRFTCLSKDYIKKDLVKYYREKMRKNSIIPSKNILFSEIKDYIDSLNNYQKKDTIKKIILIQSLIRGNKVRNPFHNLKCNNDEDFYTYDL